MKKLISIIATLALSTALLSSAQAAEVRLANINTGRTLSASVASLGLSSATNEMTLFNEVSGSNSSVVNISDGAGTVVASFPLDLSSSAQYTLVAFNNDAGLQVEALTSDSQNQIAGLSQLRVYNLSNKTYDVSAAGNLAAGETQTVNVAPSSTNLSIMPMDSSAPLGVQVFDTDGSLQGTNVAVNFVDSHSLFVFNNTAYLLPDYAPRAVSNDG